jgi:biopolymer transport protein ExbD
MAFNTSSGQQAMSEINVTPLVDVMLVLLVIFIVTAPLLMQAVPVSLPKTGTVAPLKKIRSVQVSIDAHGLVYLEQRPVHAQSLESELKRMKTESELSVQLHADQAVPYGRVAEVMASASRAGVDKLSFVTVPATTRF